MQSIDKDDEKLLALMKYGLEIDAKQAENVICNKNTDESKQILNKVAELAVEYDINDNSIDMTQNQAQIKREEALKFLITCKGDVVSAILEATVGEDQKVQPAKTQAKKIEAKQTGGLSSQDVEIVMQQAQCSRDLAEQTLIACNNDMVNAIISLTFK